MNELHKKCDGPIYTSKCKILDMELTKDIIIKTNPDVLHLVEDLIIWYKKNNFKPKGGDYYNTKLVKAMVFGKSLDYWQHRGAEFKFTLIDDSEIIYGAMEDTKITGLNNGWSDMLLLDNGNYRDYDPYEDFDYEIGGYERGFYNKDIKINYLASEVHRILSLIVIYSNKIKTFSVRDHQGDEDPQKFLLIENKPVSETLCSYYSSQNIIPSISHKLEFLYVNSPNLSIYEINKSGDVSYDYETNSSNSLLNLIKSDLVSNLVFLYDTEKIEDYEDSLNIENFLKDLAVNSYKTTINIIFKKDNFPFPPNNNNFLVQINIEKGIWLDEDLRKSIKAGKLLKILKDKKL